MTPESQDFTPRISIVVPAHDNGRDLDDCLAALRIARTPDCEIIVVDDASNDDTSARAASSGARVVSLGRNRGPAAARNEGARQSRGDILFFGGDTAYPVATAREILNRVVVPWNQVLTSMDREAVSTSPAGSRPS